MRDSGFRQVPRSRSMNACRSCSQFTPPLKLLMRLQIVRRYGFGPFSRTHVEDGTTLPKTTALSAPVAAGRFPGNPLKVRSASTAKAMASLASWGKPYSSESWKDRCGNKSLSRESNKRL
jgi:hypothetical protein